MIKEIYQALLLLIFYWLLQQFKCPLKFITWDEKISYGTNLYSIHLAKAFFCVLLIAKAWKVQIGLHIFVSNQGGWISKKIIWKNCPTIKDMTNLNITYYYVAKVCFLNFVFFLIFAWTRKLVNTVKRELMHNSITD